LESSPLPAALIQALDGRYRIEQELGRGGTATVYRALDLKHGRHVAIKVLLPDLAKMIGPDRFLSEIQTTATLQHPHILPLFDSGAADGVLYYVMPCFEGGSLQEEIERRAPMPVTEVARVVDEIGAALDYAHRLGVIHRDIKPANILLQDGNALLADFWIARAISRGTDARITETGISVGTPSYMSPEQASGGAELGPASDIYSLGVVAYEMLSGEPPFTGPTVQAVFAQLFTELPRTLRSKDPTIPPWVDAAVLRCLAKSPGDRFPSGAAFAAAFRSGKAEPTVRLPTPKARPRPWGTKLLGAGLAALLLAGAAWWIGHSRPATGGEGTAPRLLAVLPFINGTPDSTKGSFGRGLAVEITDELHRLGVGVVGSAAATLASSRFRSSDGVDIQGAGRSVGADAVLDGTLLEDAHGGRLTVELTDVSRQVVLWSATYQLSQDLFQIQDSVAREVARALHVSLTADQFSQVQRGRSVDPRAHELVVQAKGYGEQRSEVGLSRAIALYQEALAKDSTYAEAWAGLAETYCLRAVFSPVRPRDYFRLAALATDRALALDDRSAPAHRSRGFLAVFYTHDWETGRAEFQRALDLDSLEAGTWLYRTWYFGAMRQFDSMRATIHRARALDSLTPINAIRLADILYRDQQDSAARAELLGVLRRDPSNELALSSLGPVTARLGDCDRALALLPPRPDDGVGAIQFFVRTWGLCHRVRELQAFVRNGDRRAASGGHVTPVVLAMAEISLGDRAGMYRWLEYAVEDGDWQLFYINMNPEFDPYRTEPRFRELMRRAGMPSP